MSSARLRGESGASLVEYALLLALIAFVCIAAIGYFGSGNAGSLTDSSQSIAGAGP
jgi:Flp pilus assembly pilin Flp